MFKDLAEIGTREEAQPRDSTATPTRREEVLATATATGQHPFGVVMRRAEQNWVVTLPRALPAPLADLTRACLAVDPAARPTAMAAGRCMRNCAAASLSWGPLPPDGADDAADIDGAGLTQ